MKTTTIKNIISLCLFFITLIACNSPAYLSGNVQGIEKENTKIYLVQPENLRDVGASFFGTVIDSATVNIDGSFEFRNTPKTKESVLLEIALQQSGKYPNYLETEDVTMANFMPIVWKPGEFLKITSKVNTFQKNFSLEQPSEVNKSLLTLRDINQSAYDTHLKGKQWNLKGDNQLIEKEQATLDYQSELIHFANNTPYLIPALVALRWVNPENDYERVPEFLVRQCSIWKEKQPDHLWVKELCKQSEPANLPILVGDQFPNVNLPMLTQDTLSLKEGLGSKLTIIDLWASWCAPCRIENREVLMPIWEKYHNKGLQIIAYGLESNITAWQSATKRDGADRWLQASHLQGDETPFLKKIRIKTIPANFILDDQGIVLAKNIHGKSLVDWVQRYMEKK